MAPYWTVHIIGWLIWGAGVATDSNGLIYLSIGIWLTSLAALVLHFRIANDVWPWS